MCWYYIIKIDGFVNVVNEKSDDDDDDDYDHHHQMCFRLILAILNFVQKFNFIYSPPPPVEENILRYTRLLILIKSINENIKQNKKKCIVF